MATTEDLRQVLEKILRELHKIRLLLERRPR